MKNRLIIPKTIRKFLSNQDYKLDNIGHSESKVLLFKEQVLKIENVNEESNTEHIMYHWLQGKLPIPKLITSYKNNHINYLLIDRINGKMACDKEYLNNPLLLVKLLSIGLKSLWSIDISNCPVNNSTDNKLKLAKIRIDQGLVDVSDAEPNTYGPNGFKDPEDLYNFLVNNKPLDIEPSFIHGDYCLPNIFIDNYNIKFIDLGRSGIGDKWFDIALCVRSLQHNLGTDEYTNLLFDELGIIYDHEKIKYYILLDELF